MSKATKGPWRWTNVDYGNGSCGYEEKERGPFDALWSDAINAPVFVAQDASSYTASCDFPNEMDARLIAAAPDLLEALEACVAFTGAHGGPFALARAAIAKAKGEA